MKAFRDRPSIVRNVRVIDLETGCAPERPSDITMDRGRFTRIVPAGQASPGGRQVIEGNNRFALPGLIDCHVHICGVFLTEVPRARDLGWVPRQIGLNHRAHLRSGVTQVRDMAAPLRVSLRVRSLAEDPCSGFPRVLCAGPMLTVPGGYPPYLPRDRLHHRLLAGPLRLEIRSRREAVHWVDRLAGAGVDWIKLAYQGAGFDRARTPLSKPSGEWFRALVERARCHGLPVAVHHYWLQDLRELLDLPFDTLEHITQDEPIDDRTLDRMAERGLPVTTDLEQSAVFHDPRACLERMERGESHLLPGPRRQMGRLLAELASGRDLVGLRPPRRLMELGFVRDGLHTKMRNLKRLAERGLPIGAASDAGVHLFLGMLPHELCRMRRAGMPAARVLRSATVDAARILRLSDVGRVLPGYRADLVLVARDPLADMEALKDPDLVMRDGVPVLRREPAV